MTSKSAGVGFMDYVVPGRVLKLAASDQLVLGCLRSCWRETITGDAGTIGLEQCEVAGGGGDFADQARISGRVGIVDGRAVLNFERRANAGGTVPATRNGG